MATKPQNFVVGQCWSSEAEPELGVGFVRDSDPTTVTLVFPLVSETRRYGRRTAPLKRLQFREGDTLQRAAGSDLKVDRVEERDGLLRYFGGGQEILETEISPKLRIHRPMQRFLVGQWDSLESYILRQRTLALQARLGASASRGLMGPKVQLLPHQLYVVDQISKRALPRALLADEVGLGKTIEAGWILHRLVTTGRARRVLVIAPPALVNQWFIELLRRFNLSFWVPSSQSDEAMEAADYKDQERLVLGVDALLDPTVAEGILAEDCPWDLVIVDEAHRITPESPEHGVIRELAARSPGLLLLTATPEQLGLEGHFARLQLIDASRFASWAEFKHEYQEYREIAPKAESLLAEKGRDAALSLIDRYGTGRVYFRNSRKIVQQEGCSFPKRTLCEHALEAPKGKNPSDAAIEAVFVKWLGDFATAHRTKKTLLICSNPERASSLEKYLRDERGLKAVAFHEKMTLLTRDRNAAYFEDPEGASILLSSEIGGEGRNFQHATNLILTDLPADPDILEQRIGRLDRIGGAKEIQIHVAYVAGGHEETLLRWHRDVFGAFEAPAPGALPIYQKYGPELGRGDTEALFKKARKAYLQNSKDIEQGRDRLIELHSFEPAAAPELVTSITRDERPEVLRDYLEAVFDVLGLHSDDLDKHSVFVEAGDSAFAAYVPGLPPEGLRYTFSREKALARNDLALMSWDHPLVTGTIESLASQEFGNTTVAAWTNEMSKRPFAVECHFVFETSCDAKWNLPEFFAPAPIRVLLDGPGTELTSQWTFTALQEEVGPLPPALESVARRIPPDGLRKLLFKARDRAEAIGNPLRDAALARVVSAVDAEFDRLQALQVKNGAVSDAELQHWKQRKSALEEALRASRVRLDSLMVVLPRSLGG